MINLQVAFLLPFRIHDPFFNGCLILFFPKLYGSVGVIRACSIIKLGITVGGKGNHISSLVCVYFLFWVRFEYIRMGRAGPFITF